MAAPWHTAAVEGTLTLGDTWALTKANTRKRKGLLGMLQLTTGGRARCLLVWLGVTAAAVLTVAAAMPDLRTLPTAPTFDRLLVGVAAAALSACAAWAWVVTGVVVAQALLGRPRSAAPGVPRWLRVAVLVACGIAVVAPGGIAQAHDGGRSDPREVLAGLPPPERVAGALRAAPEHPVGPPGIHVVRSGDTLWDIAADDLGGRPEGAAVTAHWHAIYALNTAVIGADPDLIRPGQALRMPAPPQNR
jgi:hypothetical protein